jgi:hypothetical protein
VPEVEPVGYIIRRPLSTDKGESLLFLTRPSTGMFGNSSGTAIFACDSVAVNDTARVATAYSKQGDISFSSDLPFLVIPRGLGRPVSTADLARQQVAEKKEWDEVMDKEESPQQAVTETEDGRLKHDAQGYL